MLVSLDSGSDHAVLKFTGVSVVRIGAVGRGLGDGAGGIMYAAQGAPDYGQLYYSVPCRSFRLGIL